MIKLFSKTSALILFFSSSLLGQSNDLQKIRREITLIQSSNTLMEKRLPDQRFMEEIADGGGYLIGLFEREQLVSLRVESKLISGFLNEYYYFQDDTLIYSQLIERKLIPILDEGEWIAWNFEKTPDTSFVMTYYFKSEELIEVETHGEPYFTEAMELEDLKELLKHKIQLIKSEK